MNKHEEDTKKYQAIILTELKNYIVKVKAIIEAEGLIATADEMLIRLDDIISKLNTNNNDQ